MEPLFQSLRKGKHPLKKDNRYYRFNDTFRVSIPEKRETPFEEMSYNGLTSFNESTFQSLRKGKHPLKQPETDYDKPLSYCFNP